MNKIYLDKLIDYCQLTYKNSIGVYEQNSKKINLSDEIKKIKYNTSLNEKGVSCKYNFIELSNIFNNIDYNEMILISPISFNIDIDDKDDKEDKEEEISIEIKNEWYSLLNGLLLVLHGTYLNQSNNVKKEIINIANNMYLKKLGKVKKINKEVFKLISVLTSINIFILSNINNKFNIKLYNDGKKQKSSDKYIILVFNNNEYYPVYNFENKHFIENDIFVNYLNKIYEESINIKEENEEDKDKEDKEDKDREDKKDKEDKDKKDKDKKDKKNDESYQEVQTIEDYTLYVSEAVENEPKSKPKSTKKGGEHNSDNKKKKNNKDIFIKEEANDSAKDDKVVQDSVFNKTEIIDIELLKEKYKNIKTTTKLDEIQSIALKINLAITSGSTKDGKPKNKTKSELLDDLKEYFEK